MLRIRKDEALVVVTGGKLEKRKAFYIERRKTLNLWLFSFSWWRVLARQNTALDAAKFAANIQSYTNEELLLCF